MKKLLRYKNGSTYVITPALSIYPADVEPIEEIDISRATPEEIKSLRKNGKDKRLIDKIKSRT